MMVEAAGFEPTTTSPPVCVIASADVRYCRYHARMGAAFGSTDRGCAPLLVHTDLVQARTIGRLRKQGASLKRIRKSIDY